MYGFFASRLAFLSTRCRVRFPLAALDGTRNALAIHWAATKRTVGILAQLKPEPTKLKPYQVWLAGLHFCMQLTS